MKQEGKKTKEKPQHYIFFFFRLPLFIVVIATFEVIPVIITITGIMTSDIPPPFPHEEYVVIGGFGGQ